MRPVLSEEEYRNLFCEVIEFKGKRFNFISKYFWVEFETHTKDVWHRRTFLLRLAFAYLFYSIGWFGLWRLTPLSAIFQLYSGSQLLFDVKCYQRSRKLPNILLSATVTKTSSTRFKYFV
jgi:hypothetical protein